jgi:hypothetical protein
MNGNFRIACYSGLTVQFAEADISVPIDVLGPNLLQHGNIGIGMFP